MNQDEIKLSAFEKLTAINVNQHIEKKGNLSYLSWAWAWDCLQRQDPDSEYEYLEPKMFGETMMVFCSVTAFGKKRTAHLPVMDYKNRAVPNPDSFQVNTAMQRCLVKAIALHGLGLYIYAGEDLPEGEEQKKPGTLRPALNSLKSKKHTIPEGVTIDPSRQEYVMEVITKAFKWAEEKKFTDAYLELSESELETEEKIFANTFFDSAQRSGIAKAKEEQELKYAEHPAQQA